MGNFFILPTNYLQKVGHLFKVSAEMGKVGVYKIKIVITNNWKAVSWMSSY